MRGLLVAIAVGLWCAGVRGTCPSAPLVCGTSAGSSLGPPAAMATAQLCMDLCVHNDRCLAIEYHAAHGYCHLLDRTYGSGYMYSDAAVVADRPSVSGTPATCATVGSTPSCCPESHMRCASITVVPAASQHTSISSTTACMALCLASSPCRSVEYTPASQTCRLFNEHPPSAAYLGSEETVVVLRPLPSGVPASCVQITGSEEDCTPCTTTAYQCGQVVHAVSLQLPTIQGVLSPGDCMDLCMTHPRCSAVEYHIPGGGSMMEGNCYRYTELFDNYYAPSTYSVVANRPTVDGNLSTCVNTTAPASCRVAADSPTLRECELGWVYRDGWCYKVHGVRPDPKQIRIGAAPFLTYHDFPHPPRSFHDAAASCAEQGAALVTVLDDLHNAWLVSLIGPGATTWLGIREDPVLLQFVTPKGHVADYTRWGGGSGDCGILHTRAEAAGEPGGVNRWLRVSCGERHGYVCTKPLAPLKWISVGGVEVYNPTVENGTVPKELVLQEVLIDDHGTTQQHSVVVVGMNLHDQLWVTLQTTFEAFHAAPPGQATLCGKVGKLTEEATPIRLTINFTNPSNVTQPDEAELRIPQGWPLIPGYNYSLCWAEGVPYPTPTSPREFEGNDMGIVLRMERDINAQKETICWTRNEKTKPLIPKLF